MEDYPETEHVPLEDIIEEIIEDNEVVIRIETFESGAEFASFIRTKVQS